VVAICTIVLHNAPPFILGGLRVGEHFYPLKSGGTVTHLTIVKMAYRGTDNLRCYVREAVLPPMVNGPSAPPMPLEGHKSHLNTLSIRPEIYRKLESIYGFKDEVMDHLIATCTQL
jgi:hypothetical protein